MPTRKYADTFLLTLENVLLYLEKNYFLNKKNCFWLLSLPARNYPSIIFKLYPNFTETSRLYIKVFTVIVQHVECVPQPRSGLTSIHNVLTWNKSQESDNLSAQQELIEVTPG